MRNKVTSLIIGTALIGTLAMGTEASAAQIEVKQGDTLWNIAQTNGTTVDELKNVNNLTSNVIQPTQTLETSNKATKEEKVETTHTVKSGDTLSGIGFDYGVKVNELKDWNKLDSDLIVVNQKILIKNVEKESTEVVEEKEVNKSEPAQEEQPKETEKKAENQTEEQPQETEKKTEKPTEEQSQSSQASGQSMTMEATAYTAQCDGCTGVTATGIDLNADSNKKVVAVDPSVIPLGSRVHVEGYGEAIAGDTGGDIKGNRIDVHLPTKDEAYGFGRQSVNVTVLD